MKVSRILAYSAAAAVVVDCAALQKEPEISNENVANSKNMKRGLFSDLIDLCFLECSPRGPPYYPQHASGDSRSTGGEEPRLSAEEVTFIFENTKQELRDMKRKLKKRDKYDKLSLDDKVIVMRRAILRWNACLKEFQRIGDHGFARLIASTKESKVAQIEESQANIIEEFNHVKALILDMMRKYEIASGAVLPSAPIVIG